MYILKPHVAAQEAQIDTHRAPITFDDLLKSALRHRPDRIILGEIRGTEARTLLDAMNTGNRGVLATIHASSAQDALFRMRALLMRGAAYLLPEEADAEIRLSICRVIHIDRGEGFRRVIQILETTTGSDNCTALHSPGLPVVIY